MLGKREPQIYGSVTISEIEKQINFLAKELKVEVEFFQSNNEGEPVDKIQKCLGNTFGIIINPAAFTHTSIAIRNTLEAISIPTIEVHISNIYSREDFRHKSYVAPIVLGQISDLGVDGYLFALRALAIL